MFKRKNKRKVVFKIIFKEEKELLLFHKILTIGILNCNPKKEDYSQEVLDKVNKKIHGAFK